MDGVTQSTATQTEDLTSTSRALATQAEELFGLVGRVHFAAASSGPRGRAHRVRLTGPDRFSYPAARTGSGQGSRSRNGCSAAARLALVNGLLR